MFNNLMNFDFERNFLESLGFYFAYLFLGLILCGIAGGLIGLLTGNSSVALGYSVGGKVAIFYCFFLALLITKSKKLFARFSAIVLCLLSLMFPMLLGCLLGLIPVAILTRMAPKND
jgi:hypothetical protein